MRYSWTFAVCSLLVLLATLTASAQRQSGVILRAEVDPARAYVHTPVVYKLTVQGAPSQGDQPTLPPLDPAMGLSTPEFVGTEASHGYVIDSKGSMNMQSTVTYRYALTPSKEGTFVIPPAKMTVAGQVVESNPVTLTVTKMSAAGNVPSQLQGMVAPVIVPRNPALQQKLNGAVFVLPVVTNPNPYNGEQIRVSFHLVVDSEVLQREGLSLQRATVANPQPPPMNEFLKEELYMLQEGRPYRQQMIAGKKYDVLPLYEAAITSTKTGKLNIDAFKLSLLVQNQRRGGRGSQFPDPFADDMDAFFGAGLTGFGFSSREELVVQSMPVEINVKPLPSAGKPADFSGAVGDFSLAVTPDRDTAAANDDVIKIQLVIEGKGDTSAFPVPDFPKVPGLTLLGSPKSSNQSRKENDELISTRKVDYLVRASQPGRLEVPPFTLTAFNPTEEEYQRLESNPAEITITPGTRPAPPLQASSTPAAEPDSGNAGAAASSEGVTSEVDLRYIHTGALTLSGGSLFGSRNPWILLLGCIPPLVLLAGYMAGRRQLVTAGEVRSRRSRRALEVARRHLRESEKLLNANDRSQFFGELGRSIRGYFGDKFGLEAGSLTVGQIQEELHARDASPETVQLAERLLEQCDAARFSPVQPDREVARKAYDEATELLNRVEQKA